MEKEDNQHDPEYQKTALKAIIADYNQRYGTNCTSSSQSGPLRLRRMRNFMPLCREVQRRSESLTVVLATFAA